MQWVNPWVSVSEMKVFCKAKHVCQFSHDCRIKSEILNRPNTKSHDMPNINAIS